MEISPSTGKANMVFQSLVRLIINVIPNKAVGKPGLGEVQPTTTKEPEARPEAGTKTPGMRPEGAPELGPGTTGRPAWRSRMSSRQLPTDVPSAVVAI